MTEGKSAIITGGAGSLGRAIAMRLVSDGFRLALLDIAAPDAEFLSQSGAIFIDVDFADHGRVGDAIREAAERLKGVTALVNNAGIGPVTPVGAITPNEWRRVLDINLGGAFFAAQACLPLMPRGGAIVNVSSVAGHRGGIVVGAHYVASKAALFGLTKSLALAGLPRGVRVNAVAPGPMETAMTLAWPNGSLETARAGVPIGRLIKPDEVAGAVWFLLSDEAGAITGATLDVDGGMALR